MPTGYTAKLMEKGQTFPDFVMTCARAMGACIMMRDDPLDAPIPEKFEPDDYSTKAVQRVRAELTRLRNMTKREQIAYGETQKVAAVKSAESWLAKKREQNKRLEEMELRVRAWQPPTKDHTGLKEFMLDQINISKNSLDYIEKSLSEEKAKTPAAYHAAAVASAEREIQYSTKSQQEEVQRAQGRTAWLQQLRASI